MGFVKSGQFYGKKCGFGRFLDNVQGSGWEVGCGGNCGRQILKFRSTILLMVLLGQGQRRCSRIEDDFSQFIFGGGWMDWCQVGRILRSSVRSGFLGRPGVGLAWKCWEMQPTFRWKPRISYGISVVW